MSMDKDPSLENKALSADRDGSASSAQATSPTVPEASADEEDDGAVAKLGGDAKEALAEVRADVSNLLTATSAQTVSKLAKDAVASAKELAGDVADVLGEAADKIRDAVSGEDETHDAALRAQYDGTHALAAAGGDNAKGHAALDES